MAVKIASYNLDAISYLPLYPPQPQHYKVEVMNPNAGAISLRTDPADPLTQFTLLPGETKAFEAYKNAAAYNPGTPLLYGIMNAGTGTVKLIGH